MKRKLNLLESGKKITARTQGNKLSAQVVNQGDNPYYEITDAAGDPLYKEIRPGEYVDLKFTLDEVIDRLDLNAIGL